MTEIDQFESIFKSAEKTLCRLEPVSVRSVLVVTDLDAGPAQRFAEGARSLLRVLDAEPKPSWHVVAGGEFSRVSRLLDIVRDNAPELICTYRNLHVPATEYPYSLGVYVDVLTQATDVPVLLLPHPLGRAPDEAGAIERTRSVLAITDHLTGDHRLVSYGVRMTEPDGTLLLTHVEDRATLDRYIATIAKIPAIDTDTARETIRRQLLKEPREYVDSCREAVRKAGLPITVETIVTLGHHLADYKRLIEEHRVDLVVLNTKDEDQLAMHGVAYSLSVELRQTPLLLL